MVFPLEQLDNLISFTAAMMTTVSLNWYEQIARFSCLGAVVWLGACGGGAETPTTAALQRVQVAAAKPVVLQQLPELHQCLSSLSQKLKSGALRPDLSLTCLAGRFSGLTMQGDECFLQVDAQLQRFSFGFSNQHVAIGWADVAMGADGRPVHNLESSDLGSRQPGVQLTRFTPVPDVVTEALALRAGEARSGAPGLPQITYLRVQSGRAEEIRCRFGA